MRKPYLVGLALLATSCVATAIGGPATEGQSTPDKAIPWAFRPPARHDFPSVASKQWVRNPIDAFVLAKMEKAGVAPAKEADRATLIRRLTFDLIGLPPTPEEIANFVN